MATRSDVAYWNRRAEDYDDFITTSGFDYGRSMVDILGAEGVLSRESRVLEIASGVGAVTIPMAQAVKTVTA
ncbi:MAG: class I SAM-dependent methyltransferase, partial [Deltaproteobacteria bacterium]|nr:class I SAM-dependent methyltransferase [Deltaproteobacteria bacterium]